MSDIIYHITIKAEWEEANKIGFYEAPSLALEGFIHCSEEHQVAGVLNSLQIQRPQTLQLVAF